MSIHGALQFIQQVRSSGAWERKIRTLTHEADLEQLVETGREMGFAFTIVELRAAFTHDWAVRWFQSTAQGEQEDAAGGAGNEENEEDTGSSARKAGA